MKRKLLSLLLAFCMVASLLPMSALAVDTTTTSASIETFTIGGESITTLGNDTVGTTDSPYTASVELSELSSVAVQLKMSGKDSATAKWALLTSTTVQDSDFTSGSAFTGSSGDLSATVTGLTGSNYLGIRLDEEGTSSEYKYFVITVTKKDTSIGELTITVGTDGAITGNTATDGGNLYYYVVDTDPATTIESWTTETQKSAVDSALSVTGTDSAPTLTTADNDKYLVVVEFNGTEDTSTVVAAGVSEQINIADAGQTEKPAIKGAEETATVMCNDGNTEAVIELTNTYTGEVKVTVKDEEGSQVASGVTGKYADGKITLTFDPALEEETTYQISVTEGSKKESEGVNVTVHLFKAQTATPEVGVQGGSALAVCEEGNTTAEITVTNKDAYASATKTTVKVYASTEEGAKGEVDSNVSGEYADGTLTLTFTKALDKVTTYFITFQNDESAESEPTELTVSPVTSKPTITTTEANAKTADGATTAEFTVTNKDAYAEGGSVAVAVYTAYTNTENNTPATGVTGKYDIAEGKLTLTFDKPLAEDKEVYVTFTYTPAGDDAQPWATSAASDKLTAKYVKPTAKPEFDGEEEYVEITCAKGNTSAVIELTNADQYTGTSTVTVYKADGEKATDPTAQYSEGKITLTFTTPLSEPTTYYITLTESDKAESEKLEVRVSPYKADAAAEISKVVVTASGTDYTETPAAGAEDNSLSAPIKTEVVLPSGTELTSLTVKLTVPAKATVKYVVAASAADDEALNQTGTVEEGVVTISSQDLSSNKLFVKVTSEDEENDVYYEISVVASKFETGEPSVAETWGNPDDADTLSDIANTKLDAASQALMDSLILSSVQANQTIQTLVTENEGTFDGNEPGSVWSMLKEAHEGIENKTLHYYYVPFLSMNVAANGWNETDKTLTVDITPYYNVVASTAETKDAVDLDTNAVNLTLTPTKIEGLEDVTIEIAIPDSIASEGSLVYVKHADDPWGAYTVESGAAKVTVSGFSPFTISGKATGQAIIDAKVYSTVQEAVNAVKAGETIKLTDTATKADVTDLEVPAIVGDFTIDVTDASGITYSDVTFKTEGTTAEGGYVYTATVTEDSSNAKVTVSRVKAHKVELATTSGVSVDKTSAKQGEEVTITITNGKTVKSVTVTAKSNGGEISVTTSEANKTYKFTMPEDDVTVKVEFESTGGGGGGGGGGSSSTVNTTKPTNGSFTVSDKNAKAGDTVKVTPKANTGYVVDTVTVTDKNGKAVEVKANNDGTYSFVMPAKNLQPVTVKVTFKLDDGEKDCPSEKFTDVDQSKWYHEGVDYAIANGLMEGVSATTFAPNATTTRAMVVTILYRLEGEPAVTKNIAFSDVPAGEWYSNAITWAAANGIVNGYSADKFGPNDSITREQMAAILYRYASYKGYDVTGAANLSGYTDAGSISSWATTAMKWAVSEGLIEGMSATTLAPTGDSTRAQVATILMRFCEDVAK